MRLVISILRNSDAARQLNEGLLMGGCQAERLLFMSKETVQLDGAQSDAPGLYYVGSHQNLSIWCVREPEFFSTRIRDACSSLALSICLLDQIQRSGQRVDWQHYRNKLNEELPISIIQVLPPEQDELAIVRCALGHAVDRLQVLDLEP